MEWKEVRLGDVCEILDSKRIPLSAMQRAKRQGPYRYYGAQGIIDYVDDYLFNGEYLLVAEDGANLTTRNQDIANLVTGKFWVNNHAHILGNNGKCPLNLLGFILNNTNISAYVTGCAQPKLNQENLRNIPIKLPSNIEFVASILSSLDRKIELNNKINAQLEEMAQAIFKSWFVDFEPFKDGKFVESELGMIPEALEVKQIKDIPHILETGRRPKGGAVEKGIPSVGAEHVKGMCTYDFGKTKYIDEEFASRLKTGKINGYELLIYKDGGKPGFFIPNYTIFGEGYPFETCYLNEHVFKLDFEGDRAYNVFCYFFFQTEYIMNYLNAQGGKAAIPGINKNDVESLWIYTPNNERVAEFGSRVLPMFTAILKNAKENASLAQLRDTLLPKLMSGEIDLDEIEKTI